MADEKVNTVDRIFGQAKKFGCKVETSVNVEELETEPLIKPPTPADTAAYGYTNSGRLDFIRAYVSYADVLEAPPEAHEAVATELISSALCENVLIPHGADKIPLDL